MLLKKTPSLRVTRRQLADNITGGTASATTHPQPNKKDNCSINLVQNLLHSVISQNEALPATSRKCRWLTALFS